MLAGRVLRKAIVVASVGMLAVACGKPRVQASSSSLGANLDQAESLSLKAGTTPFAVPMKHTKMSDGQSSPGIFFEEEVLDNGFVRVRIVGKQALAVTTDGSIPQVPQNPASVTQDPVVLTIERPTIIRALSYSQAGEVINVRSRAVIPDLVELKIEQLPNSLGNRSGCCLCLWPLSGLGRDGR